MLSLVWPQPVALQRLKTGMRMSSRIEGTTENAHLAGLTRADQKP